MVVISEYCQNALGFNVRTYPALSCQDIKPSLGWCCGHLCRPGPHSCRVGLLSRTSDRADTEARGLVFPSGRTAPCAARKANFEVGQIARVKPVSFGGTVIHQSWDLEQKDLSAERSCSFPKVVRVRDRRGINQALNNAEGHSDIVSYFCQDASRGLASEARLRRYSGKVGGFAIN